MAPAQGHVPGSGVGGSFEIVPLPVHNAALEMAQRLTDALGAALSTLQLPEQQSANI